MRTLLLALALTFSVAGPAYADDVADIWKAKCKSCHGETGKADTKVGQKEKIDDMSAAGWQAKHTDTAIRKVISEGSTDNKKMKPFKDKLSAEEIDALVKHIRTFKP